MQRAVLLIGLAALAGAAAHAQTDVALSVYGAFTGTTTGSGTAQSPSNAAGGLLEVRHIAKPWFGYEGTYAYNRANQNYSSFPPPVIPSPCPTSGCPIQSGLISANAHEVTGDYIASLKLKPTSFRLFALAGGGLLLDVPTNGQTYCNPLILNCTTVSTSTTTKPVFVYGAGVDWTFLPHIGLRLQYRGNLYKAPDLTTIFTSTGAFTHTAEPMLGAFFRF
ncbi:MAG: outer membrane beta-barrel protein [Terracidiphilus sp.]